jgi:hypothetical protein
MLLLITFKNEEELEMPKILSYDVYYQEQMHFIDRYLRGCLVSSDKARVNRIQQLESKQSIHFLDEFLDIEQGIELETTRIGYKPVEKNNYHQLVLAPDSTFLKPENRRLSRYRLIHGPVDFYLGSQLEEPLEIPVITTCAPNMMGTSKVDLNDFSTGGADQRDLKDEAYKTECKKLSEFIVRIAKQEGHQRIIMPAFGVGAYIKKLNNDSKIRATKIMYEAFAEAAEKYQINIDWVIWNGDKNSKSKVDTLNNYTPTNFYMAALADDILHYAEKGRNQKQKVVIINPGSDRTIGGRYTCKNPETLEEKIAQQSDLVLLHSEINKPMVKAFRENFSHRKQQKNQLIPTKSTLNHTHGFNFKAIAIQIGEQLQTHEKPFIIEDQGNYKVSFKNRESATQFRNLLTEKGINGQQGKPKTIQKDGNYSVLYLTKSQLGQAAKPNPYQAFFNVLDKYMRNRDEITTDEYKHYFFCCIGLGVSRTNKFNAISALKKSLTGNPQDLTTHLSALENGELANDLTRFIRNNKNYFGLEIKTIAEMVDHLSSKQPNQFTI